MENKARLLAVSPVDGRYGGKTERLSAYFSEQALMKYRVQVEVEYFLALQALGLDALKDFPKERAAELRAIYEGFGEADAQRVKEIEQTTNHDVKAVEYFLKERFDAMGLEQWKEFLHFGLTSQDVNNTAFPMMLRDALRDVCLPLLERLRDRIEAMATEWADVPMLARTHGQPASPTRLGKELRVFSYRLARQIEDVRREGIERMSGKFGGATGNFNAHHVAYPQVDWPAFATQFLREHLGLERDKFTTQISNYDTFAAVFDALKRTNTVLIDLDRDVWQYISMGYFKQRIKAGEVGSSAMPHKVNPIDFENSEGNLGISSAILEFLSRKLPVSRLQRDLTDSTVIRNIGVPLAHGVIAVESTLKGLDKLVLCEETLAKDLDENYAVVAEALQTILRREGYPHPYEALKALTRTNAHIGREDIRAFIDGLNVSDAVKEEMRKITPSNYIGM